MDAHNKVGDTESDYEYEYDPVETETFYIDLDLTTANGERREPLKRRKNDPQPVDEHEQVSMSEQAPGQSVHAQNAATSGLESARTRPEPATKHSSTAPQASEIQFLDLHSHNPIVSYRNQIYSCTWSDMIGTAMFFTEAQALAKEEALLSTNDFQLVNISRIKLIGQKANLAGKVGRKRRRQSEDASPDTILGDVEHDKDASETKRKGLGGIRTGNAKVNADIERQAAFLEKLMDVKRAKGELDNVRTVLSHRKSTSRIIQRRDIDVGRSARADVFPSIEKEIEELNRKVVRGDAVALMRLQDIYSRMEDGAQDESPHPTTPAAPGQTPDDDSWAQRYSNTAKKPMNDQDKFRLL